MKGGPGVSSYDFWNKLSLISCFFFLGGGGGGGGQALNGKAGVSSLDL